MYKLFLLPLFLLSSVDRVGMKSPNPMVVSVVKQKYKASRRRQFSNELNMSMPANRYVGMIIAVHSIGMPVLSRFCCLLCRFTNTHFLNILYKKNSWFNKQRIVSNQLGRSINNDNF